MHAGLLDAAISETGKGVPCKIFIDHMYVSFYLLLVRSSFLAFDEAVSLLIGIPA
jgi:hypothetical protein